MKPDTFEAELLYETTMHTVMQMLKNGLITKDEYAIIDTKMLKKYRPLLGTLFSQNRLTL